MPWSCLPIYEPNVEPWHEHANPRDVTIQVWPQFGFTPDRLLVWSRNADFLIESMLIGCCVRPALSAGPMPASAFAVEVALLQELAGNALREQRFELKGSAMASLERTPRIELGHVAPGICVTLKVSNHTPFALPFSALLFGPADVS